MFTDPRAKFNSIQAECILIIMWRTDKINAIQYGDSVLVACENQHDFTKISCETP